MDTHDFVDEIFGRGLDPAVAALIAEAGALRGSHPERALQRLQEARTLAPSHPAPLIGLYRFHFYGHRLADAREIAEQALKLGAGMLGLPDDWRCVPLAALPNARHDAVTRFYLFALKGLAYLSLRLDDRGTAVAALDCLQALDPGDDVGGRLLNDVLAREGLDEDDDVEVPA